MGELSIVILNLFQDLMVGLEILFKQFQIQKPHKDSDPSSGGRNDPKPEITQ